MLKRSQSARKVPSITSDEVRHLVGPVTDHTMAAILACAASAEDLEVVLSHLQGEGSTVDRLGHPASGKIVQLCEVLSSEELYAVRDER